MEPTDVERRVIDAAEALALTLGDDDNHTVAAAVMDVDGRIYQAVNLYHFTGGPCAELVALGVAAAAGAPPLLTIAAAGDQGRALISPCGRCRQVLWDQHPDIEVAVPTDAGPVIRRIRDLLPDSYTHPDTRPRRLVRFSQRYYDEVVSGQKTTTVRWNDQISLGPATFVFEGHPDFAHVDGEVLALEPVALRDLDSGYAESLRGHYPTMPDDAQLTRVVFRVDAN